MRRFDTGLSAVALKVLIGPFRNDFESATCCSNPWEEPAMPTVTELMKECQRRLILRRRLRRALVETPEPAAKTPRPKLEPRRPDAAPHMLQPNYTLRDSHL